jgi:hypothetical protein
VDEHQNSDARIGLDELAGKLPDDDGLAGPGRQLDECITLASTPAFEQRVDR